MRRYLVRRRIDGVGEWTTDQLRGASETSRLISRELVPEVRLIESYVTGDSLYCLYVSPNVELIYEHAKWDGLPVTKVSEVYDVVDATASSDGSRAA